MYIYVYIHIYVHICIYIYIYIYIYIARESEAMQDHIAQLMQELENDSER